MGGGRGAIVRIQIGLGRNHHVAEMLPCIWLLAPCGSVSARIVLIGGGVRSDTLIFGGEGPWGAESLSLECHETGEASAK